MYSIAKGFVYKFCFCLGVGTATYYSYAEVKKIVHFDQGKAIESLVEKKGMPVNTVFNDTEEPQEISYDQPATAPLMAASSPEEVVTAPPVVPAEEKKDEDKKDEEKKDETAEKKDENQDGLATNGMIIPNQNQAASYSPQNGHALASVKTSDDDKSHTPELPLLPNALPTPTPSSESVSGYIGSTSTADTPAVAGLNADDVAALISPMKATFDDEMNQANGVLCVVDGHSCERRNHVAVHSLRWGMSEGLNDHVQFSIKSSGATSLEFAFNFKIQNDSSAEENISITTRPSEVLVHNESKDSKLYRVIEFKIPDLLVRGETIKQVQAVMTYEVTPSGLVLSKDSGLSFTRSKVQLLVSKWEPLTGEPLVDRVPAAQGGVFLIADELSFSMSVEKSL